MSNPLYKLFFGIEKRIRFIIASVIMTALMMLSTFFFFDRAFFFLPLLITAAYALTYFSILEGIEKIEFITLFLMPVLVTVAFYLFYFLFPTRWITRIPFLTVYAISIYAMLLVSNIFNVGVEKSLQLYRAAFSVNYFYQSLVVFLFANLILSFKLHILVGGILFLILGSVIAMHLFWSIKLELYFEKRLLSYAFFVGFILFETAILTSFVPLQSSVMALLLSTVFYCIGGLTYLYLDERLFKETVREYIIVLGFVVVLTVFTLVW